MNPGSNPANTATSLGSREVCAQIVINGAQDADEDAVDAVSVDITVNSIPVSAPMFGFEYGISYDEANLSIQSYQGGFLLAANSGSSVFLASDVVPDVNGDGQWLSAELDIGGASGVNETGSGLLQRITMGAEAGSQTGVYNLTLSDAGHIDEYNIWYPPDTVENARLAVNVVCPPTDTDGDRVYDIDEVQCGSDPYNVNSRPERIDNVFAGVSDDGDALVDEALPADIPMADCDGDGFPGATEGHVYAPSTQGDQDPCGTAPNSAPFNVPIGWPGDFKGGGNPTSTDRVTLSDVATFVAPVRRLDTSPGDPNYDARWDIVPGNSGQAKDINGADYSYLTTFTAPMFYGAVAFDGPYCPWP